MKKMRQVVASLVVSIALGVFAVLATSHQATAQTGSRLGSGASPLSSYWMSGESNEISKIRRLLQQGDVNEAVEVARNFAEFVTSETSIAGGGGGFIRYDAMNALCVALSIQGQHEEAIDVCTRAIRILPSHWKALNSRGTAYYVVGNYVAAEADYEKALASTGTSDAITELVQNNLRLARLAGGNS